LTGQFFIIEQYYPLKMDWPVSSNRTILPIKNELPTPFIRKMLPLERNWPILLIAHGLASDISTINELL
jgi:hypothetical protein